MGCCGSAEATACKNHEKPASPLAVSFNRGGADEDTTSTGLPRLLGCSPSSAVRASCETLKSGQERPAAAGAAASDLGQPLDSGEGPEVASSSAACNADGTTRQLTQADSDEAQKALACGWKSLRADEPVQAIGHFTEAITILPTSAEAYNARGIAKELMQMREEDYQADYQKADQLAADPETKKRLRMMRKWKPVGWKVRQEVEAKTQASEADFLISFTTGDAEANNATLRMLQEGVEFDGEVQPVTFCTDKSLGLGHFVKQGPVTTAKRKAGELPPWFLHYKTAAEATKNGILIVNLTRSYFNSVACMWEFGYLRRPELVHVFVPGMPGHSPRIARWEELARDASLCVRAFRIQGPDGHQQLMDALEDPRLVDPHHAESVLTRIKELEKLENKELRKQEAWCMLPLAQLSHTLALSYFGETSIQAMVRQLRLVRLCLETGQALEARDLGERLRKSMEQVCGPEHAAVAMTLNNVANACGALGDHREMKRLLEKALVTLEREFGMQHAEVAKTLNNLANACGALGDHRERKRLLEKALVIQEREFGTEHAEVAGTLNNLAGACGALGDHREMKRLLEKALVIKEREFGTEHAEVAMTLNNLATACGALGDHREKRRLLERAVVIEEREFGTEHAEVAKTLNNLANACGALGDHREMKRLLEKALVIKEREYGTEHVEVAMTLNNLANACGALGDHREEKRLLEKALVINQREFGTEHAEVAVTLNNLATACGDLGDHRDEKRLLEKALVIQEREFGTEHAEVARTLYNLAGACGALGGHREEKRLLEKALVIQEREYGTEHVEVAGTLNNLANACGALGDHREKKRLLEKALVINQREFGTEHAKVAVTLNNLANACGDLGDHREMKRLLEKALVIKEREFGTEHAEVALTLNNLAGACGDLGDHQQKKRLLERALGIFAANVGPDHPHTQAVLENLIRSHADELASEIWAALGMASG